MKKEEQIKQLRVQLLAYNDTVCFTESKLDGLKANRQVVIDQLEQLEKDSKDAKEDFSDIVITSYLDSLGRITDFRCVIPVKYLYKDFPTTQFLGYNSNLEKYIFCINRDGQLHEGMPTNMLYFGSKEEKPLKHPHMKDIVAKFCISVDDEFEVEKLTEADKINWEDWDKVQPIGEDQEYGIVVKATYRKEIPSQFSLFFCEKK